MPFYRVGAHLVHLKLSGKAAKNPPAPCCARVPMSTFGASFEGRKAEVRCRAISTILCDWPVDGKTCDAPLCAEHAVEIGRDRHLCPTHMALQREAQPELFAPKDAT